MNDSGDDLRIIKLRRTLAAAHIRFGRRHNRSSVIWSRFKEYYGKPPRLSSQFTIYEPWDGRKRRWFYEDAYQLELEAAMLENRLHLLLYAASTNRLAAVKGDVLTRAS